jgi:hypothetical protein
MSTTKEKTECSCGRSPVGKRCVGWHMLTEEQYQQALSEYNKMPEKQQKGLYHAKAIDGLGE